MKTKELIRRIEFIGYEVEEINELTPVQQNLFAFAIKERVNE